MKCLMNFNKLKQLVPTDTQLDTILRECDLTHADIRGPPYRAADEEEGAEDRWLMCCVNNRYHINGLREWNEV